MGYSEFVFERNNAERSAENAAATVDVGVEILDKNNEIETETNNNDTNTINDNENIWDGAAIKKNDVIRFQKTAGEDWIQGRVLSRAGKQGS